MGEEHMEDLTDETIADGALPEDGPRYFMLTDTEVAEYSAAREARLVDTLAALAERYPAASVAELLAFAKQNLISRDLELDMKTITNPSGLLEIEAGVGHLDDLVDHSEDTWDQDADDELISESEAHHNDHAVQEEPVTLVEPEARTPYEFSEQSAVVDWDAYPEPVADLLQEFSYETEQDEEEELDAISFFAEEATESPEETPVEEQEHEEDYIQAEVPALVVDPSPVVVEDDSEEEYETEEEPYGTIEEDEPATWVPEVPVSRIDGHQLTPDEILAEDTITDTGIPFPAAEEYHGYEEVIDEDAYAEPAHSLAEPVAEEPDTDTSSFDPFANLDEEDVFNAPAAPPAKNKYRGLFHEAGLIDRTEEGH